MRLTTPDENPAPGWTAEERRPHLAASLRWLADRRGGRPAAEPFPLLVSLGMTDDGRLLLNLARQPGSSASRATPGWPGAWPVVVRRLATGPWSAGTG